MMQHQRGMTIWGWLYVLGSIGIIALVTMKLFPIYMENLSVKKAVNKVASVSGASALTREKAFIELNNQFYIDQVNSVAREDVVVEVNEDGEKELVVSYEVRKNMLYNVDFVVFFEERVPLAE